MLDVGNVHSLFGLVGVLGSLAAFWEASWNMGWTSQAKKSSGRSLLLEQLQGAFFIDFMSLYQYMRTAQQEPSFRRAMRAMQVLYAHLGLFGAPLKVSEIVPSKQMFRLSIP